MILQRNLQQPQIGCAATPTRSKCDRLVLECLLSQCQFPQSPVSSVWAVGPLLLRQDPLVGRRIASRARRSGFTRLDRIQVHVQGADQHAVIAINEFRFNCPQGIKKDEQTRRYIVVRLKVPGRQWCAGPVVAAYILTTMSGALSASAFRASVGFIPAEPQLVRYRHTMTHCRSSPQRAITPARVRDRIKPRPVPASPVPPLCLRTLDSAGTLHG